MGQRSQIPVNSSDEHVEPHDLEIDPVIPPRLVVTAETASWLMDLMENPPEPTPAMRALFADRL